VKRALIVLLFFAARVPLLVLRQPFYDELFTRWICGRSVLPALQHDSGPPLYYWLLQLLGCPDGRLLSLLCATVAFVALLRANQLTAAALVAVFPPAVLFAVDARAYALCAMCATLGVLALRRERPWLAAAAFVLAGYSHYYGALFLVLLIPHVRALIAAAVLYAPALWLALHQPNASMAWMERWRWPDALFIRPPLLLAIVIAVALLASLWSGGLKQLRTPHPPSAPSPLREGRRTLDSWRVSLAPRKRGEGGRRPGEGPREALWTLVPLALAVILGAYVPLRFESVIAAPLMLWLASVGAPAPGRAALPRAAAPTPLLVLGAAFAVWTALGIVEHATRPPDDYREAATWVARNAGGETVVATGHLYLETVVQRPAIAFPPEQAEHPGWRAVAQSGSGLPAGTFLWVGERAAPELQMIRRARRIDPLFVNSRAVVVKVH